ncbi:MAG: hypothetical protein AB7L94_07525 [Kofleriaceae bacterium]
MFRASVVLALVLAAAPAHAEDIVAYEAEGDADTSGGDPRVAALDEAFASAVTMALAELVAPDVRAARKADLDKEIVGRARLWVAKFTVNKDTTVGERRQLAVTVRVDRDKMLARLAELDVATKLATVLLRIDDPAGPRATYGSGGEKDVPGSAALTSALRGAGMLPKRAPASGAAARVGGALPLDDDEALAIAQSVNADVATIAGVTIGRPMVIRGLPVEAVPVTATVRMIERRTRKVVGQGSVTLATKGIEPSVIDKTIEHALVAATSDVLPPQRQVLTSGGQFTGNDTPIAEPGIVLVRLGSKTPWGLVAAELKYLQGAKGVKSAVLRRLSPGGWVIGVATAESVERVAQIVKRPPTAESSVKVKVSGEIVDVTLGVSP